VGFPVDAAFDGRDALVAIGMNDEPLPMEHGFPARLVVSGLYGYVSATKWLEEIELTTWDAFDAYWIPRGWAKEVEVRVDGTDWVEADLAEPLGKDAWRQWTLPWEPESGSHTIEVRATDANGEIQTSEVAPPAPDGASGYHRVRVVVP
jgi:DMSO/TMAO reductase YedYZ molybdopterin-dependent catalytic subunit